MGLGQFADLRGGLGKKEGVMLLQGELDTPMHIMVTVKGQVLNYFD